MSYDNSRLFDNPDDRYLASGHATLPLVTCGSCAFVTRIFSVAVNHVRDTGHEVFSNGHPQDVSRFLSPAVAEKQSA